MKVDKKVVTLRGRGLNPNAIAIFIENVKSDPLFSEPEVDSIVQNASKGTDVYAFSMKFSFKFEEPKPAADGEGDGSETAE